MIGSRLLLLLLFFIVAPESIDANKYTTKSDIWSVGCTTIELLTGKPPYLDFGPAHAIFKLASEPHPPIPDGISNVKHNHLSLFFLMQ